MASFETPPYRPLKDQEIRLVTLLPGSDPEPLRASLAHYLLDEQPRYEALSYTWGPNVFTESIMCNGTKLGVTRNLHEALKHYRRSTESRTLWIDAICVNQTDNDEKAKQVPRMLDIYSGAEHRQIWLGCPAAPETADLAFDAMDFLHDIFTSVVSEKRLGFRALPDGIDSEERTRLMAIISASLDDTPLSGTGWTALGQLFTQSCFSRAWVVQEVSSERQRHLSDTTTSITWGHRETKWETLVTVASAISEFGLGGNLHTAEGPIDLPWEMIRTVANERTWGIPSTQLLNIDPAYGNARNNWGHYVGGTRSRLFEFLRLSRYLSSSEPRDKIFAFLGLLDSEVGDEFLLRPDYDKSIRDVYVDTTLFFLEREHCLDIFELICDQPYDEWSIRDLPSWAVDWTQKPGGAPIRLDFDRFGAGGLTYYGLSDAARRVKLSSDRNVLAVEANFVGIIKAHVPPADEYTYEYAKRQFDNGTWSKDSSYIYRYMPLWAKGDEGMDELMREVVRYKDSLVRVHALDSGFQGAIREWQLPPKSVKYAFTGESLFEAFWRTLVLDLDALGNKAKDDLAYAYTEYHGWINIAQHPRPQFDEEKVHQFRREFGRYTKQRRFCTTSGGLMGWVPKRARVGDVICVFPGARYPYVVRGDPNANGFRLLGPAYIHGLMEAVTESGHSDFGKAKVHSFLGKPGVIRLV